MKSLTETSTQLTKDLRDLNQDLRRKLLSMPSCTEQEMKSLAQWLEEVDRLVQDLDNLSSIICHHSRLLKIELEGQQRMAMSKA